MRILLARVPCAKRQRTAERRLPLFAASQIARFEGGREGGYTTFQSLFSRDLVVNGRRDDRIESWKQIAAYLGRDIRTVQRWENKEGLPVHRHKHEKLSSVYAFRTELDKWQETTRAADRPGFLDPGTPAPLAIQTHAYSPQSFRPKWGPVLSGWHFKPLAAVAAGIAVIAIYAGVHRASQSHIEPVLKPFTTFPGGQYEPKFSPDGRCIAFVWNDPEQNKFHIYTKDVDGTQVRGITTGDASEGSPAWSPDGQAIAYLRYATGSERCGVYVSPVPNWRERKVASVSPLHEISNRRLDWSPAGNSLAVVDKTPSGESFAIFLISMRNGVRRQLTSAQRPGGIDTSPAFSPDGKRLAFLRFNGSNANDLYVVPARGGEPRRVTSDNAFISDFAWTPTGDELILSSKRTGSLELWRVPAQGGKPRRATELGNGSYFLSISAHNNLLALSRWEADVNIWRVDIAADRSLPPNFHEIIASTMDDRSAQYSPDGQRIAFRSNRSGADEIWVSDSSGANQKQLTAFGGPLTGSPHWSNDGRYLAFDSRPRGPADIYVVAAAGGPIRRVTAANSDNVVPSWSHDGRWIYFASDRAGGWQIWKVRVAGESVEQPAVQLTRLGGFAALESEDGQWLYYAKGRDQPGIWRMPITAGQELAIVPGLQPGYWGYWTLDANYVYFLASPSPEKYLLNRYSTATKEVETLATIPKPVPFGDSGLSVSDGRSFLYPQVDHAQSNIMLVRNFR